MQQDREFFRVRHVRIQPYVFGHGFQNDRKPVMERKNSVEYGGKVAGRMQNAKHLYARTDSSVQRTSDTIL
jgi:hypothetical protein